MTGQDTTYDQIGQGSSTEPKWEFPLGWAIGSFVAILLILAGIGYGVYQSRYAPLVTVAERFLQQLVTQGAVMTYPSTHAYFRQLTDATDFKNFYDQEKLSQTEKWVWKNVALQTNTGYVEGHLTRIDGSKKIMGLGLTRVNGFWHVTSIDGVSEMVDEQLGLSRLAQPERSAYQPALSSVPEQSLSPDPLDGLPDDEGMQYLTHYSLARFNESIQAQDFSILYNEISSMWGRQTSPDQLESAFKVFVDNKIDLSNALIVRPIFDRPARIDEKDFLRITGRYPSRPAEVVFNLGFIEEEGDWKLSGLNIDIVPVSKQN